jgi:hypothetical protein
MSAAVGVSALVGLVVHSFFDGLSIGSGFVVDRELGLLLFVAIVLHKAPEGFAIASIVLASRGSRRQALAAAGMVGAASLVGGLAIFGAPPLVGPALGVSAGVTLCRRLRPRPGDRERRPPPSASSPASLYYLTIGSWDNRPETCLGADSVGGRGSVRAPCAAGKAERGIRAG